VRAARPRDVGTVLPLDDGRSVLLRDLRTSDEQVLREAFAHADPQALRARFGGGIPPFAQVADRLRRLDGVGRYAIGVFGPGGDLIGVGEYVQAEPGSPAEVALIVHHDWQRHGIGTALLQRLAEHAVGVGITIATAQVSGSNEQVLELVDELPAPHTVSYDHGVGTVRVELPRQGERHRSGRPPRR
jgi:GNAT superfamily N-acetyltransferase